ncbi:MAG: 5-methylphenazine-carboxylate 1-monooxygenase [Solirubrobacteraceae bacterium]|jgi:2-polyprenyl-6-methoxyphenol hydroxylase-like FAD-dependent oxidoreductase|nr:5-methylphenazine-carboxylate 1-monooxygenase [Solirubrobacteraceae bacterium]
MRVLVAGGGIGGLVTALSLHDAGIEVEVVESARCIDAVGAGINLLPHAVRELTELGLGRALQATGVPTSELVYHDRFGSRIWSEPRGRAAGYRWPQYSIHRGELQLLLLDAVKERLGTDAVRCGLAVERFTQAPDGVCAELRERATGRLRTINAAVLIGADGIDSAVRAQLHPGDGPPRWSGIVMWRGVSEAEPFLTGRTMIMVGSNRRTKFIAYPIATGDGRALVNWVAEVRLAPGDRALDAHDWRRTAGPASVLAHFGEWDFEWLDIPALIAGAPAIYEYPMIDRDPLPRWGGGRVSLLGDAAHPMYPIGSNGASQAIIDARVLAHELACNVDPVSALVAYEPLRRPPTTALVHANRQHGPEHVMTVVEERAPDGFAQIDDVIGHEELRTIVARYSRTAGFDVDELNARPSWSVHDVTAPTR